MSVLNKKDYISNEHEIAKIMSELLDSKATIERNKIDEIIVIFGSTRVKLQNKYYKAANNLAYKLGKWAKEWGEKQHKKYAICTGGGSGIMEASNKGAQEANIPSIGFWVEFPSDQSANPYIDENLEIKFDYLFVRKYLFLLKPAAVVVFPGGFGTLDELFGALTKFQNSETKDFPLVLFGSKFWKSLVNWQMLLDEGMIAKKDMNFIKFSDDVDETVEYIKEVLKKKYNCKRVYKNLLYL